ncbi:MAG: tetratricopeptide repeat protein [Bacteroidetes bacterium]|nr:tetratricopeptide repeat protein [Bacteroidota bacterium]
MKSRTKIILVLLIAICGIVPASLLPLYGQSEQEIFAAANKLYMDEKFDKAIEKYEQLVTMKKVSADVYFNLGNAYYKTGNFASSILNYERAQRLSPSDPDIEYNLRMANLSTIDKIEPLPRVFMKNGGMIL